MTINSQKNNRNGTPFAITGFENLENSTYETKTMMKTNSTYNDCSCGRRSAKIFCLSLMSVLLILFYCAGNISAQTNNFKRQVKTKASQTKPKTINSANIATQKDITSSNAVTVVNRVEADYLSGEASVSVNPKQPTVIRLGLAQNATSVVEFPSVDQIY